MPYKRKKTTKKPVPLSLWRKLPASSKTAIKKAITKRKKRY